METTTMQLNLLQNIADLDRLDREVRHLRNLNERLDREQATLTVFTLASCESKVAGEDWTDYGAEPRRASWIRGAR
jgi:hypothetical protein